MKRAIAFAAGLVALVKALGDVVTGAGPKFLGPQIPITGDGRRSWGP